MYGITVTFPPAGGKSKYVMIHMRNCKFYKTKKGKGPRKYIHHKNAQTFREAITLASEFSLEWHAPIKLCEKCLKSGQQITI